MKGIINIMTDNNKKNQVAITLNIAKINEVKGGDN